MRKYTGTDDMNGVKIYAGDCVHYTYGDVSYPKKKKKPLR